jgi:hypothetical protein
VSAVLAGVGESGRHLEGGVVLDEVQEAKDEDELARHGRRRRARAPVSLRPAEPAPARLGPPEGTRGPRPLTRGAFSGL